MFAYQYLHQDMAVWVHAEVRTYISSMVQNLDIIIEHNLLLGTVKQKNQVPNNIWVLDQHYISTWQHARTHKRMGPKKKGSVFDDQLKMNKCLLLLFFSKWQQDSDYNLDFGLHMISHNILSFTILLPLLPWRDISL